MLSSDLLAKPRGADGGTLAERLEGIVKPVRVCASRWSGQSTPTARRMGRAKRNPCCNGGSLRAPWANEFDPTGITNR